MKILNPDLAVSRCGSCSLYNDCVCLYFIFMHVCYNVLLCSRPMFVLSEVRKDRVSCNIKTLDNVEPFF